MTWIALAPRACASLTPLLVFVLAALSPKDPSGLDDLRRDLGEVKVTLSSLVEKSKGGGPWWGGFLGTILGAAIGVGGTWVAASIARSTAQAQDVLGRDNFIKEKRIPIYQKLFKVFEHYPKEAPHSAIDEQLIPSLLHALDAWYYAEGGGLVLSAYARRAFLGTIWGLNQLQKLARPATTQDPKRFYAVVYLFTSRLRTELIDDVDGRRVLGQEPEPDKDLDTFRKWLAVAEDGSWVPERVLNLEGLRLSKNDEPMPPAQPLNLDGGAGALACGLAARPDDADGH